MQPPARLPAIVYRAGRRWAASILKAGLWDLYQYPPRPLILPDHYHNPIPLRRTPSISIVTPSFNSAAFIEATLESVLEQDYPALEYVCQDGASSDGTAQIIAAHHQNLHAWESLSDAGQTDALNRGFRKTSGEILAYLNSDDILLPGSLAYVASYFDQRPEVDVLYSHRIMIDPDDREVGRWILPFHDDRALKYTDYIPQETMFWRRSIFEKVGGQFDESFQFAMDWDLILRFQQVGARFARVPRFLGAFRVHPDQKSQAVMDQVGEPEMNRLRERTLGYVPTRREIARALRSFEIRHALLHHAHNWGFLQV